jgi:phosphoribosylaminoimidazolecarboxamide formyltransferase / IMP cyclohydrolase
MAAERKALLSVSDKQGLVPFARDLVALSFELVSTGGTARALRDAGLPVTEVAALTGFPEIMDGRVKTLHPAVHAGLLARRGVDDDVLERQGIGWIDLLVVNLYPFEQTIARPDSTDAEAIESIDVGGPAMLRAAAKNHQRMTVVVDAADYAVIVDAYRNGEPSSSLKRRLATKAFAHTAGYDAAIAGYLQAAEDPKACPDRLVLAWHKAADLRYGENPHQRAALYLDARAGGGSVARSEQLQGKPLSFNNLLDADTALRCATEFDAPACVIVKHANPCGVAIGTDIGEAYLSAYACDPTSAFGGVIAFNRGLDAATATAIIERQFVEVVIAPAVDDAALAALSAKPNVRVLSCGAPAPPSDGWDIKSINGGILLQQADRARLDPAEIKTVTQRAPTPDERRDLLFAWTVVKYVKSNAIVYARGGRTAGIGAGQMSRVVSSRIAAAKAAEEGIVLAGAAMASDAFFPFRDSVDTAAQSGIAAIIQPGGSMRDDEVIAAADEHGLAMVFTSRRHFRH